MQIKQKKINLSMHRAMHAIGVDERTLASLLNLKEKEIRNWYVNGVPVEYMVFIQKLSKRRVTVEELLRLKYEMIDSADM